MVDLNILAKTTRFKYAKPLVLWGQMSKSICMWNGWFLWTSAIYAHEKLCHWVSDDWWERIVSISLILYNAMGRTFSLWWVVEWRNYYWKKAVSRNLFPFLFLLSLYLVCGCGDGKIKSSSCDGWKDSLKFGYSSSSIILPQHEHTSGLITQVYNYIPNSWMPWRWLSN